MLNDNARDGSDDIPRLCVSGCGFYGYNFKLCRNPEKMFFCSICYKAEELRIKSIPAPHELKGNSDSIAQDQNEHDDLNAGGNKKPSNPGRCFQCNKKIGISGFKCRCEYTFCASHRQYNKHNCTFDFKSHSREALSKANPAVIADKIEKVKFAIF
ncbi:unnamed protein product [Bathycoccus prasinos]